MPIALNIGQKMKAPPSWIEGRDHPFGTGPHSIAFKDETIDAMHQSSQGTRQSGREEGFNFCVDPTTKVQKSVVPGQRLPEQAWPWAVLNAGGRCYGDHCSVMLDKGCPDTFDIEADAETGEEYQINILPGMEYGTHHTHPDRKRVRPSVADKLMMIEDAVYQKGPAFSCITALPESMKFPPSWWEGKNGDLFTEEEDALYDRTKNEYGPDRPTRCFAIPDNRLPSQSQAHWWRQKYNYAIRPYYDEWSRLGYAPGKEYKDYDTFRKIYDQIDAETDVLLAEVEFSDFRGMKELEDITIDQNMSPGYFGGYKVALQKLPKGEGQMPPPLPKPPEGSKVPTKSSFDEIFESLANCEQRQLFHGGTMPEDWFKDVMDINDLEIRHPDGTGKSIQEVCRELSDLRDVWI